MDYFVDHLSRFGWLRFWVIVTGALASVLIVIAAVNVAPMFPGWPPAEIAKSVVASGIGICGLAAALHLRDNGRIAAMAFGSWLAGCAICVSNIWLMLVTDWLAAGREMTTVTAWNFWSVSVLMTVFASFGFASLWRETAPL